MPCSENHVKEFSSINFFIMISFFFFFFLISKLNNILTKQGQALEYTGCIEETKKEETEPTTQRVWLGVLKNTH